MKQHFLLEKAKRYSDPISIQTPTDYVYDDGKGYWKHKDTGVVYVNTDNGPGVNSKKWDRETGEDKKGE